MTIGLTNDRQAREDELNYFFFTPQLNVLLLVEDDSRQIFLQMSNNVLKHSGKIALICQMCFKGPPHDV